MSGLGRFLSEVFFPKAFTCDLCGIESFGNNLCPDCLKTVTFNNEETCPVCGRKTQLAQICLECKDKAPLFKKAVSPLVYKDGAAKLILKFKNGNGYLKEYFADLITENIKDLPEFDGIVYVPMTDKAVYNRGFNQSKLLAKGISERVGVPVIENAVVKTKETTAQKSLTRKEREKNLSGCFKVEKRAEIKNKNLLLVDDVLTTGATAEAICEKLLRAGAAKIYFATVASVEYKSERK